MILKYAIFKAIIFEALKIFFSVKFSSKLLKNLYPVNPAILVKNLYRLSRNRISFSETFLSHPVCTRILNENKYIFIIRRRSLTSATSDNNYAAGGKVEAL